jgi:hypothetical protein
VWRECLRVLKPGGYLLAFGGTRTYHRMACAIEDAGFEIRDQLQWLYGSGFPKSLDVSKALDKAAGAEREYVGPKVYADGTIGHASNREADGWQRPWKDDPEAVKRNKGVTLPATDAARQWDGWGTALKPANEPICMARKPLVGTVAANVLEHGTGALNIDACRIPAPGKESGSGSLRQWRDAEGRVDVPVVRERTGGAEGRWPANVLLDEEAARLLDEQSGESLSNYRANKGRGMGYHGADGERGAAGVNDRGGASRFFYVAKASKRERGEGNTHPTVKPVALMEHLCKLVTPPGGVVLDPYMGSGTTGIAAVRNGFRFVGIEREAEYLEIARVRVGAARPEQEALPLDGAA